MWVGVTSEDRKEGGVFCGLRVGLRWGRSFLPILLNLWIWPDDKRLAMQAGRQAVSTQTENRNWRTTHLPETLPSALLLHVPHSAHACVLPSPGHQRWFLSSFIYKRSYVDLIFPQQPAPCISSSMRRIRAAERTKI